MNTEYYVYYEVRQKHKYYMVIKLKLTDENFRDFSMVNF